METQEGVFKSCYSVGGMAWQGHLSKGSLLKEADEVRRPEEG